MILISAENAESFSIVTERPMTLVTRAPAHALLDTTLVDEGPRLIVYAQATSRKNNFDFSF